MNQPLPPSELRNFHTWQEVASDKRLWISLLRRAMFAKSKGFRLPSMKNTGRGEDRRKDKLEGPLAGVPKAFRSHAAALRGAGHHDSPRSRRAAKQI
jgi:hypothetical protein